MKDKQEKTSKSSYFQATDDPEFTAMIRCFNALSNLTFDQKVRALKYIHDRFSIRTDLR